MNIQLTDASERARTKNSFLLFGASSVARMAPVNNAAEAAKQAMQVLQSRLGANAQLGTNAQPGFGK